jgi:hypothetical protein
VSRLERAADRDAMFAALRAGDRREFLALAHRYGVTHIVAAPETIDDCCALPESAARWLRLVMQEGFLRIYAVPNSSPP